MFDTHKAPTLLLWKFTFKPEPTSKLRKITLITKIHLYFCWQKNTISSANCSSFTSTPLIPTFTPSNIPIVEAFLTNPAKPSPTIKNKKEVKGFPCLSPLFSLNSLVGLPLIIIDTVVELRQVLIQLIHLHWNPNLFIIYSKNFHSTEP